jgi:integrase/recombinase XerD
MEKRTGARKKALQIIKYLRHEDPDYNYLRAVFVHLRQELGIEVGSKAKKLPYVPTEEEIRRYYKTVWESKNRQDMIIIKTLLYTGARVSELIRLKICDVDLDRCQIKQYLAKDKKIG